MLVIRLFRVGKKHQPSFKIVVTDKRHPARAGRFVEEVGIYDPLKKKRTLKKDRIRYWMEKGAKPSDTVYNMLVTEKLIEGKKAPVHKKSKKQAATEAPAIPVTPAPTKTEAEEPKPKSEVSSNEPEKSEQNVTEVQTESPTAISKVSGVDPAPFVDKLSP